MVFQEASGLYIPYVAAGGGGGGEPSPSGTIFYDGRAGGAQSFQSMASTADFFASGMTNFSTNSAAWGWANDYDGAGKRALRIDWSQSLGAQSDVTALYYTPATYANLYVSVVIHLGRTTTGGGLGTVGSFRAAIDSTSKMKRMFFYRLPNNGTDVILWDWPDNGGTNTQINHIERLGGGTTLSFNGDFGVGTDVRWTWELLPGATSIARCWRNGVLVLNSTNATIGTAGFAELQFPSNRWNCVQDESEYWTDLVMWTV